MITILIPTFEEKNNIRRAIGHLTKILDNYDFKIIIIDDNSKDGTYEILEDLKNKDSKVDFIIRKEKSKDLTKSVQLGIDKIKTEFACVIDCDLQHQIEKIPDMIKLLKEKKFDLVIGSRFLNKLNKTYNISISRLIISKFGIYLSKILGIGNTSDPLSGFFAFNTKKIKRINTKIKTKGFKILLTILFLTRNQIKFCEININFKKRIRGKSKLNLRNKYLFLHQLYILFISRIGSGGGI